MDVSSGLDRFWDRIKDWINDLGTIEDGPDISTKISREAGLTHVRVEGEGNSNDEDDELIPFPDADDVVNPSGSWDEAYEEEDGDLADPCNTILDANSERQILVSSDHLNFIRDTCHSIRAHHHAPPPQDPPPFAHSMFVSVRVDEGAYLVPRDIMLRCLSIMMEELEHYDYDGLLQDRSLYFLRLLEPDLAACDTLDYPGAEASEVSVPANKPDLPDDGYFLVCRGDSPVLQFAHKLRQRAGHRAEDPYTPCPIPYMTVAYLVGHHDEFFAEEKAAPDPSSVSAWAPAPPPTGVARLRPGEDDVPPTEGPRRSKTQTQVAENIQWLHHGANAFAPMARFDSLLQGPRPRQSQWYLLTYPYYLAWFASQEL